MCLVLDARSFELFAGYCGLALHYSQVGLYKANVKVRARVSGVFIFKANVYNVNLAWTHEQFEKSDRQSDIDYIK